MNESEKPAPGRDEVPGGGRARTRKRYEKPAFVKEQLFETMALACGKTNNTIAQCKAVKKNS